MKFTTTVLLLASLCSADAFMVQTPNNAMQPLNAQQQGYKNEVGTQDPTATAFNTPTGTGGAVTSKRTTEDMFKTVTPITIQGGSLKTCSFDGGVERVTVFMKTTGRPLNANVELWQGPDNAPQKMAVYLEDGNTRPFRCTVETPASSNAISIRNTGQIEFPLTAGLETDRSESKSPSEVIFAKSKYNTVQGGAVYTTPFAASVQSVQIAMRTDGRPMNARIELLQGPSNNKQIIEIYMEDGQKRPFHIVLDTPGTGNVVRIVNTATVEFPLTAAIEPYMIDDSIVEEIEPNGGITWS